MTHGILIYIGLNFTCLEYHVNSWSAPPSQHIPPDKKLVQANTIRQLARGGLFFLGSVSTIGCVLMLLKKNLFSIIASPLVFVLIFSVLAVFRCVRNWFWLKQQPLTQAIQKQIVMIILSFLGLVTCCIFLK